LPAPAHLTTSLAGYRHPDRACNGRTWSAARWALRGLDPDEPLAGHPDAGRVPHRACQTEPVLAAFWDVFAVATLNLPARQASLQTAARCSHRPAGHRGRRATSLVRVPLGDLHAPPAARAGRSRRHHPRPGGRPRVEPAGGGWLVHTEGGTIEADTVVLAVPPADAEKLLPPGALPVPERLAALGASPIVNVHVVYDRPVLPVPLAAAVRSPVQWVFDRTTSPGSPAAGRPAGSTWRSRCPRRTAGSTGRPRNPGDVPAALAELLPRPGRHASGRRS